MDDDESVLKRLQDCVHSNPDDPDHHFDLALFLWENGGDAQEIKEKAAEHFVISVKLDPQNGATFRYLGHYYSRVSVDTQRALKCYQRAVALDPNDSHSGEALCDLLEGGKDSLQISVCREASEKSPRSFWAFRRLGYLQVHQKRWSEAIPCLQNAIRGYPTCADLWEALGLAYQRLGMFTAALKSYGRAIELEDSRVYALVESGNISVILGSYRKGIEQFQQALTIFPQSMCAHYGLASALLALSKEITDLGAFRRGASLLEEASKITKASTRLAGNISCVWKLHGDIQIAYAKCFPWMGEGLDVKIEKETFTHSILSWRKARCSAAVSASNSYQRALHLAPWQANIYTDIALASNLICSMKGSFRSDWNDCQLPEKMALGGLLLEGDNSEFWVALGCLSRHNALKQHAFIRGLQLDVSCAVAWAHLGKLYRKEGAKHLARQAFDCARSIDPSLALPWAGMSAGFHARETTSAANEAYESCLKSVQILPLAEFQIGLASLALFSDHLSSSQVFGAIQQSVQRAPHYPESHNLNGLVYESRFDYQSALASYQLARCAINTSEGTLSNSHFKCISINLIRSLCKAGNAFGAVQECEELEKEGMLDAQLLQIYALSLWNIDKKDAALSIVRTLAASVSSMDQTSVAVSVSFICRLLYFISGQESAINTILKMPKDLIHNSKVSFVVSSVHALDRSNRLESVVSSSCSCLVSDEDITGMHFLIALSKLVKQVSEHSLGYQSAIRHLRKTLHKFPNSRLIRNLLGYLLLCTKEWNDSHNAFRCCIVDHSECTVQEGLKSECEVLGAAGLSCYAVDNSNQKFSISTCKNQCLGGAQTIQQLQKWLYQEPWNHKARYLLILNLMQRAREERFPQHLISILKRLIFISLSNRSYSDLASQYEKFQLLLCASEINLQNSDYTICVNYAKTAAALSLPNGDLFFAHLLLCRVYASINDFANLQKEYIRCLQCKTDRCIGWICLKFIESQYKLQANSNIVDLGFQECLKDIRSTNLWTAIFALENGLISMWNKDLISAEHFLSQACSLAGSESCLFLCHGVICMELASQGCGSQFVSQAVNSLNRCREVSLVPLPIVSMLLAQAEGSLGSKDKYVQNLYREWFSWPPEMRPAELYFQMHLLARVLKAPRESSMSEESWQDPKIWILRAIHFNPSCSRYWTILQKVRH